MKSKLLAAAAMAVCLGAAGAASADVWRAFVIENYFGDDATAAQYLANQTSEVDLGSMSTPNFNSSLSADGYTIGGWLATGGVSYVGPLAGDTMQNTLWLFYDTKTFASAPVVTIAHDDGLEAHWQNITGPTYSGFTSGPTGAAVEVGSCPACTGSGLFGFVYYENGASPAILDVMGVPEPATWALMLVGIGGLGASLRARGKKAVA